MFHLHTAFKRWLSFSLSMAVVGSGLHGPAAHAMDCRPPPPAKERVPALFAQAQRVVIGRITHKGATIHETWRSRSLATIAVEKDFHGDHDLSLEVMVPDALPVGARVLVFALPASDTSGPPTGTRVALVADDYCNPTAFVMGSDEAQEFLSAIEALPPAGQGGQLQLRLRALPIGRPYFYLDAVLSEAGTQAPAPGHAAGKSPFEITIKGPHSQRRLFAQWRPRKGEEVVSLTLDHLPAGRHDIDWPALPGYTLKDDYQRQPTGHSLTMVDRGLQSRSLKYEPDATVQFDVKDDLGRAVRVPFGLIFKRINAADTSIPFHVPQEHYYQPDNDELLPSGLYSVEIALPQVSHRVDADGKLHWTLQKMQRWPLAGAQRFRVAPGANRLEVKLPASLRPIRVEVHLPTCELRYISVSAIGAILGQQETWDMGSFHHNQRATRDGGCLLHFAALPGQAFQVDDDSATGLGLSTSFGVDSARATLYTLP